MVSLAVCNTIPENAPLTLSVRDQTKIIYGQEHEIHRNRTGLPVD